MANQQPDKRARQANIDNLNHFYQHAKESLHYLILTNPAGFYAREQTLIVHKGNVLMSIINQIGNLITAIESELTHPEACYEGTLIHQAMEKESNISFPREAITYSKNADYSEIHKKLGCPGCKHAQSQYIGIGPACSKRDKQEQVDNGGKCIDLKPKTTTRR